MKYAYDFHIHSALSPCADEDMTPNNIVNMSILKQLDIIAVTDHNSAENLNSIVKCGDKNGIIVIPGIEVESSEEVHAICLFPNVESAILMQEHIYKSLPNKENRENIFGSQLVIDENDEIISKNNKLLLTATKLGIDDILSLVKLFGGVLIPAHVDRDSYSIISNLGSIPDNMDIKNIEITKKCNEIQLISTYPELAKFTLLKSSDAHSLAEISERENFIELEELSVASLIKKLTFQK